VVHVFSSTMTHRDGRLTQKILWIHSLSVSVMSQQIALEEQIEKRATDDASSPVCSTTWANWC
jgi:hypothetical protein